MLMNIISSKLLDNFICSGDIISSLINENDFGSAAKVFLRQQKKDWEQLRTAYDSLKAVQVKSFEFDGFIINVQHNPERLSSSSASTDKDSIQKRKCFLCLENLPAGQKCLLYGHEYIILANPYPIFPEHFTIPNINHFPQRINDIFYVLLSISRSMSKYYAVFYNGPACGASAPDHLHFQAGTKNFMPVINEYQKLKELYGETLKDDGAFSCAAVDDGLRRFLILEGEQEEILIYAFCLFYDAFNMLQKRDDEPMMNIVSFFEEDKGWRVFIFLREKHRPDIYYSPGDDNILLSPASVDLGGVCITPREKDFEKITKDKVAEILSEVSLDKDMFDSLKSKLIESFKKI